jgi:hypothetical protein
VIAGDGLLHGDDRRLSYQSIIYTRIYDALVRLGGELAAAGHDEQKKTRKEPGYERSQDPLIQAYLA